MTPTWDAELLKRLVAGDEAAYATLYDVHGAPLFRAAVLILGSREEAEDAVQDVFIGLVQLGRRLAGIRNLRAYLFASLRHAAARRARKADAERPELLPAADAPSALPDADVAVRLERGLAALPLEQREVVALHVDGGLTFAECAEALGISANTAASRYRYALDKLRGSLKE